VLLKDVFDYTLEEIAELVDSTLGGVKAALHRGRAKLAALPVRAAPRPAADPELSRLLQVYVERFNRRDWDGLRDLIRADARLLVADRYAGTISESPYFGRYESWATPWRLAAGELDGEPVAFFLAPDPDGAGWSPRAAIRLQGGDAGQGFGIRRIADYQHCPWLLGAAASVFLVEPPN
jgi:RNA polymerase sigma-70 factor (ECF subfamily)